MLLMTLRAAIVLAALRFVPGTGLDVMVRARARGETIGQGTVYPLLWDLRDRGFLSCTETEPKAIRGGRRAYLYLVTEAGIVALDAYRTQAQECLSGWMSSDTEARDATLPGNSCLIDSTESRYRVDREYPDPV